MDTALGTEARHPGAVELDLLPLADQLALAHEGDRRVVAAVEAAAPRIAEVVRVLADRVEAGGRLVYVGAGSAGRIAALDAAEIAPTYGVPDGTVLAVVAGGLAVLRDAQEGLEDDTGAAIADLDAICVGPADSVLGVSASGSTPYTCAALAHASACGATTVALVNNTGSELERVAERALVVPTGPELVAGSTRMLAGTAQKMVLNQVSTLLMVRLGHTYGDLMVGVCTDNAKLRDRAHRVVRAATGADDDTVGAVLAATGDARTAVVVLLADVPVDRARDLLAQHRGRVRAAVEAAGGPAPRARARWLSSPP